jgi:branched-chain amino acid transport system permease protein
MEQQQSNARARALKKGRVWKYALVAILAVFLVTWPLFYTERFLVYVSTLLLLTSIGAACLHLILRTGRVTLAHAAFLGIGSYVSVLAVVKLSWAFPVALLAACAASGFVGLLVGPIVMRLSGVYFVLLTFAMSEIIRLIFINWQSVTGGSNGIFDIPRPYPFLNSAVAYYYLALGAAVICVGIIARVLNSELGHALTAIGEDERLAESTGVPALRFKVIAFVLSCALLGIQGSLQAHFIQFISPQGFTFFESLDYVIMNVIGGMGSLLGAILGTVFVVSLPEFLRDYVEYQFVFFGLALIIVLLVLPGGLVELGSKLGALSNKAKQIAQRRAKG